MKVYRVTQDIYQDGRRLGSTSFWTPDEQRAKDHASAAAERGIESFDIRDPAVPDRVRQEILRAAGAA